MSSADGRPISVLHVDDEPDLADLVATYLERSHDAITVETATSAHEGLDILDDHDVDCIVSDHDMPGMDGLDFLRAVRAEYPELPFVLFTGKGNEEIASDAISAGVTEYLQKGTGTDQYAVLANRIERAVGEYRAKAALEESERMLSTLISNLPGMAYRCLNERGWPMEFVSEGCRGLTGYDPEELAEGDVSWGSDVIFAEDTDQIWERVQGSLDDRDPFEVTYRIRTAEGDRKWVWEQGRGIYDGDRLIALEGIILDVNSRLIDAEEFDTPELETVDSVEDWDRLVDRIEDGFMAVDDEWEITYVNARAEALVEREAQDLVGRSIWSAFPEAVGSAFETQYREAMSSQEPVTFEARYGPLDRWFEVRAFPGEGGLSIYFQDVTDRREREETLERYRMLVQNVGDPMYVLNPDGTIAMANQAMADHLGYEPEEIVGSHSTRFMPEEDVQQGADLILELLESDRTWGTFEMETIHADGSRTINEDKIAALTDDDGTFVGSIGVIRDISDRKERERELERYETIIQAVDDPVYALDESGYFTFVNEAAEALTGYAPSELVGEHVTTVISESDHQAGIDMVDELQRHPERTYATYEVELQTKDGRSIPAENHISLLPADDGFVGTAGVIRDITERKQRERRLEEFASVVSHDLQSPLNVITGRAELALETGNLDHVEDIVDAAVRMEDLIADLLTLARQGEMVGDIVETSLADVAEESWKNVRTTEASLQVAVDRTLEADPDRLRELLENLFSNAVTHGGNDVRIQVGALEDGFYVADDGRGIPDGQRSSVFEHGHSTSEDGTGLGLAIVSRIAEAHGWTVSVTESADGGARFEFTA